MSSWRKYGGTNTFEHTSDMKLNSLVTNYFTILKQITNDIDVSGNITVSNRLNVYGDVSFNQNLTVEGNVNIHNDLDISGNSHISKNLVIDGNLTVLNHLYFQDYPINVFMYGNDTGISINKEHPQADFDIYGSNPYTFNVKSNLVETQNIICRNVNDKGIKLTVDNRNATIGYYFDNPINIDDMTTMPDAYLQYNQGGILHIDALDHVQIVSNLIITDVSSNIVNDAVLTIYNDLSNTTFLYDVYDLSYVNTGTSICGVAVDNSANISINLITKNTELGGALYGGAYPKDLTRGMLSIGTTDFSNNIYTPAQTIVSGSSNVVYKNTTGINKAVPILDKYSVDVNGTMHLENIDITTAANIPFEIDSMRFSRKYSNTGVVIGGVYKFISNSTTNTYSQNAYITKDGGSSWYASSMLVDQPNYRMTFMKATWVYDDKYILAYGGSGTGYCLDISNNIWHDKTMNSLSAGQTNTVIDIFACDFSGNKNTNNALAKVFFVMSNGLGTEYELRYFDAAFGENTTAYSSNPSCVLYKNNDLPIQDNTNPYTYYRYPNISNPGTITGKCIDGAGFIPGIAGNSGYIYIAGNTGIRKYLFKPNNTVTSVTEVIDCSHNVNGGYNAITVVDMSNAIAVGNGYISHTVDGGKMWIDISTNTAELTIQNTILQSVWAYDASNVIAVGNKGAIVYTTNGYDWKNAPKQLFDLSGSGFPLIDASLNNAFIFNKNDFIVASRISNFKMDADASNIGHGKIIYNHVPDLLNSANNSVLDLCGNMVIAGNIVIDRPSGNIGSTGNNFYIASNTPNIFIGDKAPGNIYLGNNDPASSIYINSKLNFSNNVSLSGGFNVTNGNISISAPGYVVSHGIDISYANVSIMNVTGGNAVSRVYNGHDVSYAFHVKGYRPAARVDASLSVNQLYVDFSSILLGPVISTYKTNATYNTDPALSITGYSKFGSYIDIDGSNSLITLSNGKDATSFPGNNSYGGLYLKDGTGAYIDGNVFIARNVIISGTGTNVLSVGGTTVLNNLIVSQTVNITGNIAGNSDLTILGKSHFKNKIDLSGNIDISGNLTVQGNITYTGALTNASDYRIKTNVVPLCDTSFNIDRLLPKYYYNTLANSDQIGFIAHELQEEYPFLVSGVKDGDSYQGVNYPGLIGVLVKEIQELKQRVTILEQGGV